MLRASAAFMAMKRLLGVLGVDERGDQVDHRAQQRALVRQRGGKILPARIRGFQGGADTDQGRAVSAYLRVYQPRHALLVHHPVITAIARRN